MYFPTNWGAKEPQNLPNHRVVSLISLLSLSEGENSSEEVSIWVEQRMETNYVILVV